MRGTQIRIIAAKLAFVLGFSLMILGSLILTATIAGASRMAVVPAFIFFIIGIGFAIFAIKMRRKAQYIFISAFFVQIGLLLLLKVFDAIPVSLSRLWPILSIFAGIALIPALWYRSKISIVRYLVPSVAFILLGAVLLLFSLKMVPISFKTFFLDWWPAILLLLGFLLFLISLRPGAKVEEPGQ